MSPGLPLSNHVGIVWLHSSICFFSFFSFFFLFVFSGYSFSSLLRYVLPADLLAQDSPAASEAADLCYRCDSLKDFIVAFTVLAPCPSSALYFFFLLGV